MHKSWICRRAGVLAALVGSILITAPLYAFDEAADLKKAIELFDQGEYLEAQEVLAGIDRSKLAEKDQAVRDNYLDRARVAINMAEKALRDLEDGETAMNNASAAADAAVKQKETSSAVRLFETVLANEYAPPAARRSAIANLRSMGRQAPGAPADEPAARPADQTPEEAVIEIPVPAALPDSAAQPATPDEPAAPAPTAEDVQRARSMTLEADRMVQAGRYDEAERLYNEALAAVAGYPEAVAGLGTLTAHRANIHGTTGESLADRLRLQDALAWQHAEQAYLSTERTIRDHVARDRYDEAHAALVSAQQVLEANKQFADPISKYEALRGQYEALAAEVREAERRYNEDEVARVRAEVETQRNTRRAEIEANKKREIDTLMRQANEHKKDGDYDAAIGVLKQVLVIDPRNEPAQWMLDAVEVTRNDRKQRTLRMDRDRETVETLIEVEEAKVPWHGTITYPKDWPERISRPERNKPGSTPRDSLLISSLEKHVPMDIKGMPFGEVIPMLAEKHNINMLVDWHDLKLAGVEAGTPITLRMQKEITLRAALTHILDQAGGDVELAYDVSDGIVNVATEKKLAAQTYTAVYPIDDILMAIPNFNDAPISDLADATHPPRPRTRDDQAWRFGDDDDDEPEADPARDARVREIISLIQETIGNDSWQETGGTIGTIKEINGQLVVTQNTANQQSISGLLDKLREQRAIQIGIEARFLTVSSHYLEEFGIDLDIVLNNGNAGFDIAPTRTTGNPIATDPVLGSRLLVPRSVSRLGFGPATPALGTALANNAPPNQPATNPALIPGRAGGSGSNLTPVPAQNSVLEYTDPAQITHDIPGTFAGGGSPAAMQVFGSFLDNIQVDFLIRATQADARSSVLTAPRLVLFNGQRSWVAVTVQTNFVSGLTPVVSTGAVAQQPQTGTINAGAVLDVQAVVTTDKRYVTMTIRPGVTRLNQLSRFTTSGGTAGGQRAEDAFVQLPELSSQLIKTTVSVPDGGTLLIGGQKLAAETEVDSGVPGLSKIPILKRLYSSRVLVKDEQTLLILVKPQIFIQSEQEELAFPGFGQG